MDVTAEYKAIFAEEAAEHLTEWEAALLELERSPGNGELVHQMFRAIHTLKGSAGFIGFEALQRSAHEMESALQEVREGTRDLSGEMVELLFQGLDLARRMVERFTAGQPFEEDIETLLSTLKALSSNDPAAAAKAGRGKKKAAPSPAAAAAGAAVGEPAAAGSGSCAGGQSRRYECALCIGGPGREAFLRAFLLRHRLSAVATIVREEPTPEHLRESGEKFAYRMTVECPGGEAVLREAMNVDQLELLSFRQLTVADGLRSGGEPPPEDPQEEASGPAGGPPSASEPSSGDRSEAAAGRAEEVVRVSVERLDTLLNLVGELVIQNSGFQSVAAGLRAELGRSHLIGELEDKTEALGKITRDLQDGIMKVRMLPVNTVFARFHRVVRDLAKDRGKEIHLEVYGETTEIDKKVMDRIGDPLVHLVRNAVDHGIEDREARTAAGKNPVALVRLGAYQDGDHICIEVGDDGRGLDRRAIVAKAVEKGLVEPGQAASLTDEQVLSLIFLPGFSTAARVSEVSGRGVGMDVVKRAIEAMGGALRIRSAAGRGTTVTISLPLTMAIIPAVLVEVGGSILAVPLSAVKEVLKVTERELSTIGGRPVIRLREEVLSMVHLAEALHLGADGQATGGGDGRVPVIVVDYEEKGVGLAVERVIGTGEIVIKSLSRHYREIDGLIGASILGNGRIALIVDVEAMVRRYHHRAGGEERSFTDTAIFGASLQEGPAPASAPQAELEAALEAGAGPQEGPAGQPSGAVAEEPLRELSGPQGAALEEIHNSGAVAASMAVSQLTGAEIRVSFPESQIAELSEVAETLGGAEEPAGGIYVGLSGALEGGILMVVPQENLLRLDDLLHRREAGSCREVAEVDLSATSELGNILSASFINAISDATRLGIKNDAPEISVDMTAAVIDSVLARFNAPGERILLTRALIFVGESEQVVCHLLLFLEPASMACLLDSLSRGAG